MANFEDSSTSALLEQTLILSRKDPESDECWDLIWELRKRGEVETFEQAKAWCDSGDSTERALAADLLSQLGYDAKIEKDGKQTCPFAAETVPLLERLLDDTESSVIDSAVSALGHHDAHEPITDRPWLLVHSSSEVRYTVACALCGAKSKIAIEFLIKLSGDEDDDVRDWSTFGLGTLCHFDTPDIREALFRRLDDEHGETRSEAIIGLARRKDARTIRYIKRELDSGSVSPMEIEAAGHIGSPELVDSLEELSAWWEENWGSKGLIEAALRSCKDELLPEDERRWEDEGEIVVPDWATEKFEG